MISPTLENSKVSEQNMKEAASTSAHHPHLSDVVSSPWGNNASKSTSQTSFHEVMSEQLAVELSMVDNAPLNQSNEYSGEITKETYSSTENTFPEEADTSSDAVLAQMLQTEMDKEYNEYISTQEHQVNKNSKVTLSFSNYRTDEMFVSHREDDDDEDDDDDLNEESNSNDYSDQNTNIIDFKNNDKGYVIFGNEVITKHDKELCGRRNTRRLENSFPTNFRTGDATGMDLQLNNRIYNSLRKHAFSEQKRGQRLHENKQHSTAEHAIDEKTRLIMHRFIDRGIIADINGIVSIGKEAVVVHADGGDILTSDLEPILNENNRDISCTKIPKECAIKVFKTTLNEFKTREKYIKDDYRFKDRFKKHNPRKVIHMWAEKEMHNLVRMFKAGIPCPEVVLLKKHVLVMSFIGRDHQAAPKLKDTILSKSQKILAYEQVVNMMKILFKQCKLVHADLSEFNLLWHEQKVWMIDVSQSVEPSHPNGLEFLLRDCKNISSFFKSQGVEEALEPLQLFNVVSGMDIGVEDPTLFLKTIREMQSSSEEHSHQSRNKSSQIFEHSTVTDEQEEIYE